MRPTIMLHVSSNPQNESEVPGSRPKPRYLKRAATPPLDSNMTFGEGHPRGTEADDVGRAGKRRVEVVGYVRHETRIEILGQPATSGDGTAEKVDASLRIAKGPITIVEGNCHPVRAEADDVGAPSGIKSRQGRLCLQRHAALRPGSSSYQRRRNCRKRRGHS